MATACLGTRRKRDWLISADLKAGVTFVVGKVVALDGHDDETRLKVEKYLDRLNVDRA